MNEIRSGRPPSGRRRRSAADELARCLQAIVADGQPLPALYFLYWVDGDNRALLGGRRLRDLEPLWWLLGPIGVLDTVAACFWDGAEGERMRQKVPPHLAGMALRLPSRRDRPSAAAPVAVSGVLDDGTAANVLGVDPGVTGGDPLAGERLRALSDLVQAMGLRESRALGRAL